MAICGLLAWSHVRGYNGKNSRWYQTAVRQKAVRIVAAGMTNEVAFEPVDGPINDCVGGGYRAKYRRSPHLSPMISARSRSARSKGRHKTFLSRHEFIMPTYSQFDCGR